MNEYETCYGVHTYEICFRSWNICVTNDHGYVLVVVVGVTQRVAQVEQELITRPLYSLSQAESTGATSGARTDYQITLLSLTGRISPLIFRDNLCMSYDFHSQNIITIAESI